MFLAERRQEGEQRLGIAGPVRSKTAGVAGKMILEADGEFWANARSSVRVPPLSPRCT